MSNPTELPDLAEAVRKLVKAKGRFHTEQNYKELADALAGYDARRAQPEGEAPQAARPPATGDEPHGYWLDGEWYGYHPDEQAVEFEVGSTVELTPVWTHGQAATFNVVGSDDSDDVSLVPASPADAALCNWTETPTPAATLSPLCGAHHAESGKEVALHLAQEALQAVQRSYGMQLLSYPPQDAWMVNGVDEKVRTAMKAIAAQLDGGQEGSE